MAKDTREKILYAALEVFSRNGYEGTNLKDIADSVGVVKSALYRHFGSKEEIWNAVLEMMIAYYKARFGSADRLPGIPRSTEELYEMTMRMVDFTVHDADIIRMRKLLLTEQFRSERIRLLASTYFLYGTESIFSKVFAGMMENGSLKKGDPDLLALAYTTPITSLIHLCDREPDREQEALSRIRQLVRLFISTYANTDPRENRIGKEA